MRMRWSTIQGKMDDKPWCIATGSAGFQKFTHQAKFVGGSDSVSRRRSTWKLELASGLPMVTMPTTSRPFGSRRTRSAAMTDPRLRSPEVGLGWLLRFGRV